MSHDESLARTYDERLKDRILEQFLPETKDDIVWYRVKPGGGKPSRLSKRDVEILFKK